MNGAPLRPLAAAPARSCHVCRLEKAAATRPFSSTAARKATYIPRPRRPYSFTQLIALSDGSTFTHRTCSPQAVYVSVKDARNSPMWNPSDLSLSGVDDDVAGRLKLFRQRFGRGFEAKDSQSSGEVSRPAAETNAQSKRGETSTGMDSATRRVESGTPSALREAAKKPQDSEGIDGEFEQEGNLMDLIGEYDGSKSPARTASKVKGKGDKKSAGPRIIAAKNLPPSGGTPGAKKGK